MIRLVKNCTGLDVKIHDSVDLSGCPRQIALSETGNLKNKPGKTPEVLRLFVCPHVVSRLPHDATHQQNPQQAVRSLEEE